MISRLAFVATAIATVVATVGAQQRPVFHSEADYVEVDAVVTDKQGEFVPGLTAADFDVREAHQPQRLEIADLVDLGTKDRPASVPSAPMRIRPGLAINPATVSGRVYLLFFSWSTPLSLAEGGRHAREFITDFVEPGDLVGIWNSGTTLTFTTDKAELLKSLPPYNFTSGATSNPHELIDAVQWLGGMQGRRKSLLLFSPGWPALGAGFTGMPWVTGGPARFAMPADLGLMFSSTLGDVAGRTDVQVYAIDSRGLVAPPLWNGAPMFSTPASNTAMDTALQLSESLDQVSASVDGLRSLADESGGFAIVNTNSDRKGFARIVEDNSRYYVLGFSSSVHPPPRRAVALSVKVLRPGLSVRARKSYVPR